MASVTLPQRQSDAAKFSFDTSKPRWVQVLTCGAQIFGLIGGLVFELVAMLAYPMLLTGWGYMMVYLAPIAVGAVVMMFLTPRAWCPATTSPAVRIQFRLGMGLCVSAWFVGAFGIANGYATAVVTQDAPMVYRRTSTPRDPQHMSFYVGARVWPASRNAYEVMVPQQLYAALDVPVVTESHVPRHELYAMPDRGLLRLRVGQGRFGINWLRGVAGQARSESASPSN